MGQRRTRRRRICLALGIGGLLAVLAAPAAATESAPYCSGDYTYAGEACAGPDAHSGVVTVFSNSDHSVCLASAVGYGGYKYPSGGNTVSLGVCGYGAQSIQVNFNGYYHGAVWNQNASTADYIYNAHIDF